jgi:hypothetical protein
MTYSDHALDAEILDDDIIPHASDLDLDLALDSAISSAEEHNEEDTHEDNKSQKKIKAHVVRRNVEDYLERKALEHSLKEVFDDDYILD